MIIQRVTAVVAQVVINAINSGDERKMQMVEAVLKNAVAELQNARFKARQAAFARLKGEKNESRSYL